VTDEPPSRLVWRGPPFDRHEEREFAVRGECRRCKDPTWFWPGDKVRLCASCLAKAERGDPLEF